MQGMRESVGINGDVALYARDLLPAVVPLEMSRVGILNALGVNDNEAGAALSAMPGTLLLYQFFLRLESKDSRYGLWALRSRYGSMHGSSASQGIPLGSCATGNRT